MSISARKRLEVFKRDGYRCVTCGSKSRLTIDHILPQSEGGGDEPENLQTMCAWCNSEKGNFAPTLWQRVFPLVRRKELQRVRDEMLSSATSKDMLVEKRIASKTSEIFESKWANKFIDIKPKIVEYAKEGMKVAAESADLKIVGFKNSVEAYGKRSQERDDKLLKIIHLLAAKVEELEQRLGVDK